MDFIKGSDIDRERFYKVPKMLFLNKKYKGLSLMAKMAYSVIKDRMELSKRKGYTEPDGMAYVIFKQKDLAEFFGVSLRTIKNIFTELKEAGLLEVQKQGMCRPAKVYLAKVECSSDEEPDFSDEGQNQRIGGANDFTTVVNADSPRRCDDFHPHMSETDISETDRVNIEEDDDDKGWQEVLKAYQNNINPMMGEWELERLQDLFDDFKKEWVIAAIKEAVEHNARSLKYITAILEQWHRDGFKADKRKKKGNQPSKKKTKSYSQEDFDRVKAELERKNENAGIS